jgi:uncharacterized protein (TIGR02996 family)
MSDEGGLFDAILASPDDEALRLIHADWFEEHGDADRAEFVRLQCALAPVLNLLRLYAQGLDPWEREARLPEWHGRLLDLSAEVAPPQPTWAQLLRETELLRRHRRRWNGAIHRRLAKTPLSNWVGSRRCGVRGWAYRRGFVEALACTPEAWRDHAPLLRRLGPIRYLRLHEGDDDPLSTWKDLDLAGLEVVSIERPYLSGPSFQALLTADNARTGPVLDLRRCQVWYDAAVDAWLRSRPEQMRRVLYQMPSPLPPRYYPPPFLPTRPQALWLIAWSSV